MSTIADLVIKLSANTAAAEKDISSFSGKVSKGFGRALLPAVGILGGLGVAAKKTTDAATALGESQNAVNVVFGDSAGVITKFAKVADKQAGLSMRQLNELVTPIGASLINMGDSADVAADKSVALAKRAADMASVFNVDVSDALGAIQAGLRGEADPLERFGVGLSDAAVSAHAVKMGLAKTTAELTAADKAQARYALLMKQTNKLQGDFVNTSGSAANAARINAAASENLQAKIGTGLLPVVQTYQAVLAKTVAFLGEHTSAVKIGAAVLGGLAVAVLLVNAALMVYGAGLRVAKAASLAFQGAVWLVNAALAANPIALVIIALVALGAAFVVAYKKSEMFRNIVTGAWNSIKAAAQAVVNWFTVTVPAAFQRVLNWVKSNWPIVAMYIAGPFAPLVALATNAFGVRTALIGALNAIKNAIQTGIAAIVGFFRSLPGRILGALGNLGGLLYGAGQAIIQGLINGLKSKLGEVTSLASSIAGKIASVKGPLPYDRVLLVPHGAAIIGGLMAGMQSQMPALERLTSGIAPQISANVASPSYDGAGSVSAGGGPTFEGVINLDGREVARGIWEPLRDETRRQGRSGKAWS